MNPVSTLDLLVLACGALAGLLVLGGCGLILLCVLSTRRPPPVAPAAEEEARPGWLARTVAVLLGGVLLAVTCVWWVRLHVAAGVRPADPALLTPSFAPLAIHLFPWD